jgi:hypothetical protein
MPYNLSFQRICGTSLRYAHKPLNSALGGKFIENSIDMETNEIRKNFQTLLEIGSRELYEDYPHMMESGQLVPTPNIIADDDLRLFFIGFSQGLFKIERGARFNTLDRPRRGGRWGLLSRSKKGGWYNAEYLPQLSAYVHAIVELGYPSDRVFFELPDKALKLDLAILNNQGQVFVLGEAKRNLHMLDSLIDVILERYAANNPGQEGRNEPRQLAWRLWETRAPYLWLIGPGERRAFRITYSPLSIKSIGNLPTAKMFDLHLAPPKKMDVPNLR